MSANSAAIVAIVVAIITGIVGPMLTLVLKKRMESRKYEVLDSKRRKALSGHWEGDAHQDNPPVNYPKDFTITLDLNAGKRSVSGKLVADYRLRENQKAEFRLHGGFLKDRFIQLDYRATDTRIVAFGTVFLELNPAGDGMDGWAAGYGAITQAPVGISITIHKIEYYKPARITLRTG